MASSRPGPVGTPSPARMGSTHMNWYRLLLVPVTLTALAVPAPAGVLFSKHPKPNPSERIPELLTILKTDQDEHKRASAAEELRQFDAAAFPDMVPVLLEVLQNDAKP